MGRALDLGSPEIAVHFVLGADYFVGMQLRFNDEDLKSILPFAPKTP